MSQNYGWIKILDIIDQVKMELKTLNEQGKIIVEDCLQWGVEALRDIGTPSMFDEQWALVKIHDYTGVLPNDVYQIDTGYKLRHEDFITSIEPILTTQLTINTCSNTDVQRILSLAIPLKYGGTELKLLLAKSQNLHVASSDSFILQGRRVITSYKHGFFLMNFFGLYLDDEGNPMIPDDIDTINAVKAYIKFKLFEEAFYMQQEGINVVYVEARTQWENKKAMAQNSDIIPTISEAVERVNSTANRYFRFRIYNGYNGRW